MRVCAALLIFAFCAFGLDAVEIVRRACATDNRNLPLREQYTYRQTVHERVLTTRGDKVRRNKRYVEDVIYIAGAPYSLKVAENGQPLSPDKARDEQKKMDKEIEKRRRQPEAERRKRLDKEQAEERRLRDQIPEAFYFTLAGEESVNGRQCYRITAEPRPDFRPRGGTNAEFLRKVRGTMWIDKADYAWAKIDAETIAPFSVKLGLFKLDTGARMFFEQSMVNDELWAPKYVRFQAPKARAGYFFSAAFDFEMTFSDYRKFSVDSRVEIANAP